MENIVNTLKSKQIIQTGNFTLKSGKKSNIYIDLRLLLNEPILTKEISILLKEKIIYCDNMKICGIPYGAIPYACCISTTYNIPQIMIRKEQKNYGTKKLIEGVLNENDNIVLIEDIITTGSSLYNTIKTLEENNIKIHQILVIIDRTNNNMKYIKNLGYKIDSLLTIEDILDKHDN
tara:strand:+ start:1156 stop:1686 length:531 start_codon:yes stop_codon:yes gene_type:complete